MQDTVELKLPVSGKVAVIRAYTTGRIEQAIESVYLGNSKISAESEHDMSKGRSRAKAEKVKQTTSMDATVGQTATNKALELMVISLDGNSDNIVEQILDLTGPDYKTIVEKVNEITDPDPKDGSDS